MSLGKLGEAVLEARLDSSGVSSGLDKLDSRARAHGQTVEQAINSSWTGIKAAVDLAIQAWDAGKGVILGFTDAYLERITEIVSLEGALRGQGQLLSTGADELLSFAESLQTALNVSDETTLGVMRQIEALTGLSQQALPQAAQAAYQWSAITGKDVTGAATDMAKAINGNMMMLGRYGVHLEDTGSKAQNLQMVLGATAQGLDIMKERAASSAGRIDAVAIAIDEMKEQTGEAIIESAAFQKVQTTLLEVLTDLKDSGALKDIAGGITGMAQFGASAVEMLRPLVPLIRDIGREAKEAGEVMQAFSDAGISFVDILTQPISKTINDARSQFGQNFAKEVIEFNRALHAAPADAAASAKDAIDETANAIDAQRQQLTDLIQTYKGADEITRGMLEQSFPGTKAAYEAQLTDLDKVLMKAEAIKAAEADRAKAAQEQERAIREQVEAYEAGDSVLRGMMEQLLPGIGAQYEAHLTSLDKMRTAAKEITAEQAKQQAALDSIIGAYASGDELLRGMLEQVYPGIGAAYDQQLTDVERIQLAAERTRDAEEARLNLLSDLAAGWSEMIDLQDGLSRDQERLAELYTEMDSAQQSIARQQLPEIVQWVAKWLELQQQIAGETARTAQEQAIFTSGGMDMPSYHGGGRSYGGGSYQGGGGWGFGSSQDSGNGTMSASWDRASAPYGIESGYDVNWNLFMRPRTAYEYASHPNLWSQYGDPSEIQAKYGNVSGMPVASGRQAASDQPRGGSPGSSKTNPIYVQPVGGTSAGATLEAWGEA
jgi:hypothetical protein